MKPFEQIQEQTQGCLPSESRELFSSEAFEPRKPGPQTVQQAAELLKPEEVGNAEAHGRITNYYLDGVETYEADGNLSESDLAQLEKALPLLIASARQGDKEALYILAEAIGENSVDHATNAFEKTKEVFEKEARGGDAISKEIFDCLNDGRRNEVAAELFKKAADQGDEGSIYMLGQLVKDFNRFGHGLKSPLSDEARRRYIGAIERYACQGNLDANVIMGELHELGVGGPVDGKKAEQYYRKAAESGNKAAQLHMGIIYYEGDVVGKNLEESSMWFKAAGDVVDWQLSQVLNNQMGRGTPAEVFAGVRQTVERLADPAVRASILKRLNDDRRPYDSNMIEFAKKAQGQQ